jgi:hypothetical protein
MASNWYYMKNGAKYGPLSSSELKQLARDGLLAKTDTLWKEGLKEWQPASKVKGLFDSPVPDASVPPPPPKPPIPSEPPQKLENQPAPPSIATAAKVLFGAVSSKAQELGAKAAEKAKVIQANAHELVSVEEGQLSENQTQSTIRLSLPFSKRSLIFVTSFAILFLISMASCVSMFNSCRTSFGAASSGGSKTKVITKREFREMFAKIKSVLQPGDVRSWKANFVKESDVKEMFGEPQRTQTAGNRTYWYWDCSDGMTQMVIEDYESGLTERFVGKGVLAVTSVNDY